jgi:two-component system, LytTR family, response regulator
MQLNSIIVDDERNSRESLYSLIKQNCPAINVVGMMNSVKEAKDYLKDSPVDVIFLDIAMPVESGFDLIPSINTNKTAVVFTTAYESYAIKAIRANAIDYLLKPIDIIELKNAETKIMRIKSDHTDGVLYNEMLENLNKSIKHRTIDKITLTINHSKAIVNISDIVRLEGENNYTTFYLKKDKPVIVCKTLKEYEDILDKKIFVRVHKSSIINLNYIKDIIRKEELIAEMQDGTRIHISRRRWPILLQAIEEVSLIK